MTNQPSQMIEEAQRFLSAADPVMKETHLDYIPIERFLDRTGFTPLPEVTTSFTWRETNSVSCNHPMKFWIKEL